VLFERVNSRFMCGCVEHVLLSVCKIFQSALPIIFIWGNFGSLFDVWISFSSCLSYLLPVDIFYDILCFACSYSCVSNFLFHMFMLHENRLRSFLSLVLVFDIIFCFYRLFNSLLRVACMCSEMCFVWMSVCFYLVHE
jgi:hypothetical protein